MNPEKIMAFDLECFESWPDKDEDGNYTDWRDYRPVGVTCAAATFKLAGDYRTRVWHAKPERRMTQSHAAAMVKDLYDYYQMGYRLVTFNGLGFDWQVLAEESGEWRKCAALANVHWDIMFQWFCHKGWRIGQNNACQANDVFGKMTAVTLNDGTVVEGWTGAMAPEYWRRGEAKAVIAYLKEDVRSLLDLALTINEAGQIRYKSGTGRVYDIWDEPRIVERCMALKQPYVRWIKEPTPRMDYYGWVVDALVEDRADDSGVPF